MRAGKKNSLLSEERERELEQNLNAVSKEKRVKFICMTSLYVSSTDKQVNFVSDIPSRPPTRHFYFGLFLSFMPTLVSIKKAKPRFPLPTPVFLFSY